MYIAINYSIVVVVFPGGTRAAFDVGLAWGKKLFHSRFQVAFATELVACFPNNRLYIQLQEEVKLSELILTGYRFLNVALGNTASNFSVLFGPRPKLLPLDRVISSLQIRRRLLSKHILDGQDFVEKLELLLSGTAVMV